MAAPKMQHRCAVCWEQQSEHAVWFAHVVAMHGATVGDFGMRECWGKPKESMTCPGIAHDEKLPNRAQRRAARRARPEPQPFKAKDGTVYTPVPLFERGSR
jgi:hypothetical protein